MKIQKVNRLILILIIMLINVVANANTFNQIKLSGVKADDKQIRELAYYIDKSALKYGLDSRLLTSIIAHESMFKVDAVNYKTQDYGIGQINVKTIKAYKFDKRRILTDAAYSIDCAAKVLSWFKRYESKSTNWYCRYNVGTGKFTIININRCLKYVEAVQLYQFETLIAKE